MHAGNSPVNFFKSQLTKFSLMKVILEPNSYHNPPPSIPCVPIISSISFYDILRLHLYILLSPTFSILFLWNPWDAFYPLCLFFILLYFASFQHSCHILGVIFMSTSLQLLSSSVIDFNISFEFLILLCIYFVLVSNFTWEKEN